MDTLPLSHQPPAPPLSETAAALAPEALAQLQTSPPEAHPLFRAAIRAAIGSRFGSDCLLAVAGALRELAGEMALASATPSTLPGDFRLILLAEALEAAAPRHAGAVPRALAIPPKPATPQRHTLTRFLRSIIAELTTDCGTDAGAFIRAMSHAFGHERWRLVRGAEIAEAMRAAGLACERGQMLLASARAALQAHPGAGEHPCPLGLEAEFIAAAEAL